MKRRRHDCLTDGEHQPAPTQSAPAPALQSLTNTAGASNGAGMQREQAQAVGGVAPAAAVAQPASQIEVEVLVERARKVLCSDTSAPVASGEPPLASAVTNGLLVRAAEAVDSLGNGSPARAMGCLVYDALHGDALPPLDYKGAGKRMRKWADDVLEKVKMINERHRQRVRAAKAADEGQESRPLEQRIAELEVRWHTELLAEYAKPYEKAGFSAAAPAAAAGAADVLVAPGAESPHAARPRLRSTALRIPASMRERLGDVACEDALDWLYKWNERMREENDAWVVEEKVQLTQKSIEYIKLSEEYKAKVKELTACANAALRVAKNVNEENRSLIKQLKAAINEKEDAVAEVAELMESRAELRGRVTAQAWTLSRLMGAHPSEE